MKIRKWIFLGKSLYVTSKNKLAQNLINGGKKKFCLQRLPLNMSKRTNV